MSGPGVLQAWPGGQSASTVQRKLPGLQTGAQRDCAGAMLPGTQHQVAAPQCAAPRHG